MVDEGEGGGKERNEVGRSKKEGEGGKGKFGKGREVAREGKRRWILVRWLGLGLCVVGGCWRVLVWWVGEGRDGRWEMGDGRESGCGVGIGGG